MDFQPNIAIIFAECMQQQCCGVAALLTVDGWSCICMCTCLLLLAGNIFDQKTSKPLEHTRCEVLTPITVVPCRIFRKEAKLDWMYAGSLAAKHEAQARQDAAAATAAAAPAAPPTAGVPTAAAMQHQVQQQEQPLASAAAARHQNDDLSRAERAVQLPSFMAADTPASQNEQWARLHNDPLLAIKKQEQDALKKVRENPIKMQQILKEVGRQ
jgi:hypothetical protein